ncbi:MAG: M48 family metallopeptidase [Clostridiales bacterium]|nr:M48 family metallopeptidase [Clostridiales bacterium]
MAVQPDQIIYSNRKTLAISIDSFGRLIVRAPKRCDKTRIFNFLKEKENWISRKKAERTGAGIDLPGENLDGYSLLLEGERYGVALAPIKKVRLDEREKRLYVPQDDARAALVKWLKAEAKRRLSLFTNTQAAEMQTSYRSVRITSAKGRWGSCSYNDAVHYSFRLIYAPTSVIQYVVTHELAHTKHKNHSAAFWQEVEKYCPDWREKRAWLKKHAILMEIF